MHTLLEFLYEWMSLYLLSSVVTFSLQRNTKCALQSKRLSLNLPCRSEEKMTSLQSLYIGKRVESYLLFMGAIEEDK